MSTTSFARSGPSVATRAAVLAIVLAGCGGGSTGSAAPPATSPPTATTGSAPIVSVAPSPAVPASPSLTPAPVPSFDPTGLRVELREIARGFTSPLGIATAGDGSNRVFVVEQGGTVRIVRNGQVGARPFLDIADRISSGGERGLLGLAFHPSFPDDPRLFVDYTDRTGDTQVSSFRVDPASPDVVDAGTEERLLHVKQPYPNHNGGALAFGPDGFLFISLGDGGSGGDPQGNGQSTDTLLAKILRIDVDRPSADRRYGIPNDNPFAAGGGKPEIWLTGLRNPWRMSFDRATGDLWIGDVGQASWEEVDVQRAGVPGGTNFGWNRMEGSHCYRPTSGCEEPSLVLPVTDYGHDQGCTVIGGVVARGTDQPALTGGYLFADYCSGRVWAIDPSTNGYRKPTLVGETGRNVAAFAEDEAGRVLAVDISGGTLLEVTATRG